VERTIDGKHGKGREPYKPVHETAMDSRAEEAARMLARSASDKGDERMIDSYGHPRLQSAKLSREEPDAGNLHVRVCGGRGWQHPRLPGRRGIPPQRIGRHRPSRRPTQVWASSG
jgi:hypothetical protein